MLKKIRIYLFIPKGISLIEADAMHRLIRLYKRQIKLPALLVIGIKICSDHFDPGSQR